MANLHTGGSVAGVANVDGDYQLLVAANADPLKAGSSRAFSEVDDGTATGTALCLSPESDRDYRLRVSQDSLLDIEVFNYAAQNTGKFRYANTTMAATWSSSGFLTNSGSITTVSTGVEFGSYAFFPLFGASNTYCEMDASWTGASASNTIIDFGLFLRSGANPYTPSDGVYFKINSVGFRGCHCFNGVETLTPNFNFTFVSGTVYRWVIAVNGRLAQFWVNNVLVGELAIPISQGNPYQSVSVPFSIRHAVTSGGAAGSVTQMLFKSYNVSLGGTVLADQLGSVMTRTLGSHQGLSGGTMGSLASYANSANPTAAVPTNTTAALGSGLGGQFWETDTLAVTTDGIIDSYQVPAGTVAVQGRRLCIYGVMVDSFVQTALTGGGYNAQWSIAFGHTSVSLATAEAATTKAPRREAIGSNSVASGAVALTQLARISMPFTRPIIVNPGEFVAVVKKKVGTAPSAGVIAHTVTFDYDWI